MRASSALVGCLGLGVIFATSTAAAHFELKSPAPSHPEEKSGKGGFPCGPDDSSTVITNVTGGSQIAITVDENVFHPGHYRVALSLNKSNADIAIARMMELPKDPVVRGANNMVLQPQGPGTSVSADIMDPPVFPVLVDNLFAHTTNMKNFTQMITLPNVTCERCTLQVIEFMAEHGADYYYRHCADLKITADPGKPIFDPGGTGGTGGTDGTGGAGGGTGGAAGGTGGVSVGGTGGVANGGGGGSGPSGGTPNSGGLVGTGGASSTGGTGTGGTGVSSGGTGVGGTSAVPPASPAEDDGGCSLGGTGKQSSGLLASGAALLLGLGLLGRRRNRTR